MKLIRSNGRTLTVRDIGPQIMALQAGPGAPLPILDVIEDDDAARERLRRLLATGHYRKAPEF